MARLARLVIPVLPYHITQRGNRRQWTFFDEGDYRLYLDLLAEAAPRAELAVWSYCLMPNHVHLIVVPAHEDSLRAALSRTHARTLPSSTLASAGRGTCGRDVMDPW